MHQQILKIDSKIDWQIDEISSFLNKKGFFQTTEPTNSSVEIETKQVAQAIPNKPTLKVTFPDGAVFYDVKASQTMVKTIQKIGAKQVYDLKIPAAGFYLVDNQNPKKSSLEWHTVGLGFWLNTSHSNLAKMKFLEKINDALKLNLVMEII